MREGAGYAVLPHLWPGLSHFFDLCFFAPLGWCFVFLAASLSTSPEALAGQLQPPLQASRCAWMAQGGQVGTAMWIASGSGLGEIVRGGLSHPADREVTSNTRKRKGGHKA